MSLVKLIIIGVLSFLVGGIPFSFIITRLVSKKDIRDVGSGNPGATNVVRALNAWYGLLVLILDVTKGALPIYFARQYPNPVLVPIVALSLVLGHDYSPYLKFKGGRGVATSFGIFFILAPVPTFLVALVFFLITCVFKFVSFGSVMASISYPIIAYLLGYKQYLWLAIVLGGMIIIKHKDNLKRLWDGSEKRAL